MFVAGAELKVMLQDDGCYPDIIGGNGSALPPQLGEESGKMVRGLVVRVQQFDTCGIDKFQQQSLVFSAARPQQKTRTQFTRNHPWQINYFRGTHNVRYLRIIAA